MSSPGTQGARIVETARVLREAYPADVAQDVLASPSLPTLIDNLDQAAAHTGVSPATLLRVAADLVGTPGTGHGTPREAHALALAWTVHEIAFPPPEPGTYDELQAQRPGSMRAARHDDLDQQPLTHGQTPRARIIELTTAAADLYADAYAGSPAAAYVRGRLGTDLTGTDWTVGHAPAGWATLTDALRRSHHASDTELVDAGLATPSRRGTLIDRFRDRLMLGIRTHHGDLVGFTGRAAPGAGPDVPKYLNTPTTSAFTKGQLLFGWDESRHAREHAATPVRVEGALDAIAVTLAGHDRYYGLAPLGTALTDAQTNLLAAAARHASDELLYAADVDPAGRVAARKDHTQLTWHNLTIRELRLSHGSDPADAHSHDTLTRDLTSHDHPLLAHTLIQDLCHDIPNWAETRVAAARAAATLTRLHPLEHCNALIQTTATALGGDGALELAFRTYLEPLSLDPNELAATSHLLDHTPHADTTRDARITAIRELIGTPTPSSSPPTSSGLSPPITACFPHPATLATSTTTTVPQPRTARPGTARSHTPHGISR